MGHLKKKGICFTGTSGWQYKHWKGLFYPKNLRMSAWFDYYCQHFDCVELNSSFYHQPTKNTFEGWGRAVPEGFVFTVKAPRYFTHLKKLSVNQEALLSFLEPASALGEHLGPILFQLPPKWRLNLKRMADFIALLPKGLKVAVECRDPTWFTPPLFTLLEQNDIAFCIYQLGRLSSPVRVTASFVYLRLHGPLQKYKGDYSDESLKQWAIEIKQWTDSGRDVYVFFDNDEAAYAPHNALRLVHFLKN